jgi:hypothetical protein
MADLLPDSVRYVKNGAGGKWWSAARGNSQIHAGWSDVPDELLRARDLVAIKRVHQSGKMGPSQDFNALRALLDQPNRHLWVTFQDGCMWWCTVADRVDVNPQGESEEQGHFWLTCTKPWSDRSVGGVRHLVRAELPGNVAMLESFRATVCEPSASKEILRIIRNEEDADVARANFARAAYVDSVAKLVALLGYKDFEQLIDLILSRTGWARLGRLGGTIEGVDIEVENVSADEIAFVQIKSSASQKDLDDYVAKFTERRARYHRMIFAVHSPGESLASPSGLPVQVWTGKKISELVVKLGLGDWVSKRF